MWGCKLLSLIIRCNDEVLVYCYSESLNLGLLKIVKYNKICKCVYYIIFWI